MELVDGALKIHPFVSVAIGLVVLFLGREVNQKFRFLREYNIPEPVTGGLLVALLTALLHFSTGVGVEFDLADRDMMLIYFFTTIGINARLSDLVSGGKPLAILLGVTILYMLLQNLTGISVATLFGLQPQVGLLGGTVSLVGGHGTAIAWAPTFAKEFGIGNAMEIGIASATFGLILASIMGGPIAKFLINRHQLQPTVRENGLDVGIPENDTRGAIDYYGFLRMLLAVHISVILGYGINQALAANGFKLPLFVTCLFAGILLSNTVPLVFRRVRWPARTASMALMAEVSLGIFLAMSLMSMQIWAILDLAGPIITILAAQFVIAVLMTLLIVFRVMGRNYDAAVISAGFGGISLGSTATAMANMTAVTHRYGNSHLAFIVVPLVCAFFVDIVNAVMIRWFMGIL
ncbi:MAG TPA: sodium/glutamate symporter [Sedimenticola sp.]|nr:sodium/glutamate symporter [Sedimenticola sp.]